MNAFLHYHKIYFTDALSLAANWITFGMPITIDDWVIAIFSLFSS